MGQELQGCASLERRAKVLGARTGFEPPLSREPPRLNQAKGKGLVILLYGTPGSGKTLTAECCAEMTGHGLFSTNLAELNKEDSAWYFEQG